MMNRILAFDYGDKRVGIALSDPLNIIASPYCILKNNEDLFNEIEKIILVKKVNMFVVGLPLNMDGTKGFQSDKVIKFTEKLCDRFSIEIKFIDERESSKQAIMIQALDKKKHTRHEYIDDLSAAIILQQYLDY